MHHLLHQRHPGLEQAIQALGAEARCQSRHIGKRAVEHREVFVFPVLCFPGGAPQVCEEWGQEPVRAPRPGGWRPLRRDGVGAGGVSSARRDSRTATDATNDSPGRAVCGRSAGPALYPQRLAQCLQTGFQRLVADKLVRPQVLEEFLLGNEPLAMRQEIDEHLKHLAPELERLPRAMQLLALRVQDILAKDVAHRPLLLTASEHMLPRTFCRTAAPHRSHTPLS